MTTLATTASFTPLAATAAMAVACAALSVFVVARRWAFIGEGISHSGFGGAGAAWLLMLAVPAMTQRWVPYLAVVLFCAATAVAIGYLSRGNRVTGDAAIGIFLVASLAFGLLAQQIFRHVRGGENPPEFDAFLYGRIAAVNPRLAIASIALSFAVLITLVAMGKEILAYCFDPLMAQASGVRTGFVHYLLMMLIAVTIIIGMPITGSLLVTALLVLPGVTASLLSRRLNTTIVIAIAAGLIGAIVGVWVNATWRFVPTGPAIVLTLFVLFLIAYVVSRVRSV